MFWNYLPFSSLLRIIKVRFEKRRALRQKTEFYIKSCPQDLSDLQNEKWMGWHNGILKRSLRESAEKGAMEESRNVTRGVS